MEIIVSKENEVSIYKQIVNQITEGVKNGSLLPGEKLPTQRDISIRLNIARGTLQKAFEELENKGIIETIKGSGTFVKDNRVPVNGNVKQAAEAFIDDTLEKLVAMGFTMEEIRSIIDNRLHQKLIQQHKVRIVAIECNPEALEIFKSQMTLMENAEFRMFVVEDVLKFKQPEKVFEDYDLIITTITHYEKIKELLFPLRDRLFKVAVSPAPETIIQLVSLPRNTKLGVIVKSINFRNIMLRHLKTFHIDSSRVEHGFASDAAATLRLLQKDVLIIPQCFHLEDVVSPKELLAFRKKGGRIIEFKYQMEQGSLIFIEQKIESILQSRYNSASHELYEL